MGDSDPSAESRAVELASRFYEVLLRYLPPSTTLGELAVLTEVAKGVYRQRPVTVREIARDTGISRWSVSRSVLRFIENGWLMEKKDPKDSRKNLDGAVLRRKPGLVARLDAGLGGNGSVGPFRR